MSGDPRKPSKAERDDRRREDARTKARAMREQQERAARRRRLGLVTGGVIAAAAVVTLVVVTVTSGGDDDAPVAVPASATSDGGFVTGDPAAPVQVGVYLDYQCPFCAEFEAANAGYLQQARESGDVAVTIYPLDILSRLGDYSTRAGSAAACVAEEAPDALVAFNDTLFAEQPAEGEGGLPDDRLVEIADEVGAGAASGCITDGTYREWVTQATAARDERVTGTPTVLVDGTVLEPEQLGQFQQVVDDAVAAAGA
ncbi:DsbA family protein [Pseudokineococcus lusitanus]|uniref:Protein-disulfide isomerase n=1 Tax=Pseudokineococcus lusitanus TaxID=763993 RepID=A0A3N1HLG3_9ACTN|nr:thioredoxin domain-containing protein [Pseudokineococcus lusitanus]ROP43363.1 protein-disulfide isomerase [Pseudokineococcus lusitanus]